MSKKTFENLDSIILGDGQIEINEVGGAVNINDSTSTEVEVDPKSVVDDGMIEIEEDSDITVETTETKIEDKTSTETQESEETEESTKEVEEVNPIESWGNYFKENDLLAEEDLTDFDGTQEGLFKAFEKREIRTGLEMVESYKAQQPAIIKHLLDNWEEGVPLDKLINIKSNQIRYSNLSNDKIEESVDTQKAIYSEYLKKTTKYSDAKIEKEIARLVDLDELKDEAKEVLGELKTLEAEAEENIRKETKKEQELRLEENHKIIKAYEKASKEIKEIIPGIKITEKEQKEILDKTINPVGLDGNNNQVTYIQMLRNEDPIAFDIKLNYLLSVTKNLKDFSKISNSITTKATKDLTNMLNIPAPKSNKTNISAPTKDPMYYLGLPQNKKK